ncbi:hypothetical protein MVEG_09501 [Podila verticillata NRRL 6337]|nr:hypothetical protein MVEG_09501 [Podila verticillata NRRL 6337]
MSVIKLLSSSKNVRCFPPYTESPRTLSIELTDGRTLYLRAKKDLDLERWFFVLSKIWSLQQLISSPQNHQEMAEVAPSGCTRAVSAVGALDEKDEATKTLNSLPARQQSMRLIHKYLSQRRQQRHDPQHDDPQQHHKPSPPPEPTPQTSTQQMDSPTSYRLIPLPTLNANKAREIQERYQIPVPPRLSRFLPSGFDWEMEDSTRSRRQMMEVNEDGDDCEKVTPTTRDDPKFRARSPPALHPTSHFWDSNSRTYVKDTQDMAPQNNNNYEARNAEMTVPRQPRQEEGPVFWPAITTLAPEKAAAIDAWRRSLLSPLMMSDEVSHLEDSENKFHGHKGRPSQDGDNDRVNAFESPIPGRNAQEKSDTFPSWAHQKDECNRSPLTGTGSERVSYEAIHLPMPGQSGANRPKTMLFLSGREEVETHVPIQRRASYDMVAHQLSISPNNFPGKDSEELPLGLIKINRYSRWQKTQLSSEDGASAANRNSFPTLNALDALLPPAPITPKQKTRELSLVDLAPPTAKTSREEGSTTEWVTAAQSDPTLSLHGSSYSHLPIHDPDFVYPRQGHPMSTHPMSSNRRPSCPQLGLFPSRHSSETFSRHHANGVDHTSHQGPTHTLVSFTRSHLTLVDNDNNNNNNNNRFLDSRSVPSLMMRRESSPLPGGQNMQESLARYYEQKKQQRQSWLQWQQDDENEEEEEESEEDDEEENEPLAQTRERRQQSIQSQQAVQFQVAQAMVATPVAPLVAPLQTVETVSPLSMMPVQEMEPVQRKEDDQAQEFLMVVPLPSQAQAPQVQELTMEPESEEDDEDDDVSTPATSDDEDMDEFCYF